MNEIKLQLDGLHCAHCAKSVKTALMAIVGVNEVEVNLANQLAVVQGSVSAEEAIQAVVEIGFEAILFKE